MTGITESFLLPGTGGMALQVTVWEEYDTQTNSSSVTVGAAVVSETVFGHIYDLEGVIEIDGVCVQKLEEGTSLVDVQGAGILCPVWQGGKVARWTMSGIRHGTDGSCRITLAVRMTGWSQTDGSGWTVTGSRVIVLTNIPQASTLGATDGDIGSVSMVAIHRNNDRYTHTLAYRCGALTGYVYPGGLREEPVYFYETVVPFLLPESFYTQLPNSKTGICTLTLCTFCDAQQIGEAQSCSITVTASADKCKPALNCTVEDVNEKTLAVTGSKNALVRFISKARCTLTAQGKNGASILSRTVNGQTVTGEYKEFSGVESSRFTAQVTDSRGYSTSVTVQKAMVPYVHLTANVTAQRTDPTSGKAKLSVNGAYYNGSFGAKSNSLQVRCRLDGGDWVTLTPGFNGNNYGATAQMTGLDYRNAYMLTVEVQDELETVVKETVIGKGTPIFDWGEEDVCFHVPVRFLAGFRDETGG